MEKDVKYHCRHPETMEAEEVNSRLKEIPIVPTNE